MATTTKPRRARVRLTEEEREQRRTEVREKQMAAVERLRSSEGWQAWLTTRSRFHRYSFGNQLLIAIQRPTATRAASFRDWLKLGYCVQKGEAGIKIWVPIPPSRKRIEEWERTGEGERPRVWFKIGHVFAQDQVAPLPPPAEPVPLTPPLTPIEGDELAAAWNPLVILAGSIGSKVTVADTGHAGGVYRPTDKSITISEAAGTNMRVKTLIHEIGHALVRADKQDDDPALTYAQEELVVESVAFAVTAELGLDTSDYSVGYLTFWSEETDIGVIESTAKLVNRLASRIEKALEPVLAEMLPGEVTT